MEYGERVLIPSHFPWSQQYLEMRRFGSFGETLLHAFLFRMIESSYPSTTVEFAPVADALKRLCVDDGSIHQANLIGNLMNARPVQKTNVWKCLASLLQAVLTKWGLDQSNVVESLYRIASFCNFAISDANTSQHDPAAYFTYAVDSQNTLFLLYRYLGSDSFITFPCPHSDLKYRCYQQLQRAANSAALTAGELGERCAIYCPMCSSSVESTVISSCFGQQGPPTYSVQVPCCLCKRKCDIDSVCEKHSVCLDCIVQNYFRETAHRVPCCLGRDLSDATMAKVLSEVNLRANLLPLAVRLPHYRQWETVESGAVAGPLDNVELCPVSTDNHPLSSSQDSAHMRSEQNSEKGQSDAADPLNVSSPGSRAPKSSSALSSSHHAPQVQRLSHCYTCHSEYTSDDARYQCRSQCQCKVCTAEALIGRNQLECIRCHSDIPRDAVLMIQKQFKRCHVCGIAVPIDFIAVHIKCNPCLSCVVARGVNEGKTLGRCSECPGEPFILREKEVKCIQAMKQIGTACCERANDPLRETVLRCGHVVCKIHRATLLVCRVCRKRTQLS